MARRVTLLPGFILLMGLAGCQAASLAYNLPTPASTVTVSPTAAETPASLPRLPAVGQGTIVDFAWGQDGSELLVATTQQVNVHAPTTLALKRSFPFPPQVAGDKVFLAGLDTLLFYPDDDQSGPGLWDVRSGAVRLLSSLQLNAGSHASLVGASPDGGLLVELVSNPAQAQEPGGSVRLWNLKTGQLAATLYDTYRGYQFTAAAFSPDGRMLAVGCTDTRIYVWDLDHPTAAPLQLGSHNASVSALVFSPDGRVLISGGHDARIYFWDVAQGASTQMLTGFKGWIKRVAVSPDGRWLAASDTSGTLKLRSLQDNRPGAQAYTIPQDWLRVGKYVFDPQSEHLAVLVDDDLRLLRLSDRQWLAADTGYGATWSAFAWSADGKTIYSHRGASVQAWDAVTGGLKRTRAVTGGVPNHVAASPDGALLVVSDPYGYPLHEEKMIVIEAQTGLERAVLQPRGNQFNAAPVFSPDGRRLAVAYLGQIGVWDVATAVEIQTIPAHGRGCAFTADGEALIVIDDDGANKNAEIQFWDIRTRARMRSFGLSGSSHSPLAVSADRALVAVVIDIGMPANGPLEQRVEVRELASGRLRFQLPVALLQADGGLAFSPDGALLAVSAYDRLLVAATASGETLVSIPYSAVDVAFSPDGQVLAAGGETLTRWDVRGLYGLARTPRATLTPLPSPTASVTPSPAVAPAALVLTPFAPAAALPGAIRAANAAGLVPATRLGQGSAADLAWSPDGRTLAVAGSLGVHVYDSGTLKERQHIQTGTAMDALAFSPDGKTLAAGGWENGETLQLWDLAGGRRLPDLNGEPYAGALRLRFSRDGRSLLSWCRSEAGSRLVVWNVASGQAVQKFGVRSQDGFALSPDGRFLLEDGARIWDVVRGEIVYTFRDPKSTNVAVDWNADGRLIAIANQHGVLQLWDVTDPFAPRLVHTAQFDWKEYAGSTGIANTFRVRFSPNGRYLALAGADNRLRLWDVREAKWLPEETGAAGGLSFSPDGRRLAAISAAGEIVVWNLAADGRLTLALRRGDHAGKVTAAVFVQPGDQILSSDATSFHLWSQGTNAPPAQVLVAPGGKQTGLQDVANVVAYNPAAGQFAFGYTGGQVRIWDTSRANQVKEFTGGERTMRWQAFPYLEYLLFSPDGNWLAGGDAGGEVMIWNTRTWELRSRFYRSDHSQPAFSPDGRYFAFVTQWPGAANSAYLIDAASGKEVRSWLTGEPVVAFAPDGVHLLVGRTYHDLRRAAPVAAFAGPSAAALSVAAFNPGGDILALGREDGCIELWDVAAARRLASLDSGLGGVSTLTFSGDGRLLLSGYASGALQVWKLPH